MDLSQLEVLYEDNHIIGVNKRAGWLVQGDETGDATLGDLVKHYIKVRHKKPGNVFLGTIHRLDRPVSGLVFFARTSKGLERMNRLFQERAVKKTYWAVCINRPEPLAGKLEHYLVKDHEKNRTKAYNWLSNKAKKGGKKAILNYELKATIGDQHLIEVDPITGRPHQIRIQMKELGCPIKGDMKYGYPRVNRTGKIYLHCKSMSFIHPVSKKEISVEAPLPAGDNIWDLFSDF